MIKYDIIIIYQLKERKHPEISPRVPAAVLAHSADVPKTVHVNVRVRLYISTFYDVRQQEACRIIWGCSVAETHLAVKPDIAGSNPTNLKKRDLRHFTNSSIKQLQFRKSVDIEVSL
jgi:hypothetical protein